MSELGIVCDSGFPRVCNINPIFRCKDCNVLFTTQMREFSTGATRQVDTDKLDFEGFLNPLVLTEFAKYMHKHRFQADGKVRDSDNWQKGIPREVYMKSLYRHFMDLWLRHRGEKGLTTDTMEEVLSAIMFNTMGYFLEFLNERDHDRKFGPCTIPMESVDIKKNLDKFFTELQEMKNSIPKGGIHGIHGDVVIFDDLEEPDH